LCKQKIEKITEDSMGGLNPLASLWIRQW